MSGKVKVQVDLRALRRIGRMGTLWSYGARGVLALERLSRAEDGRIAYRMKRPLPDGTTHLLFTGLELLNRMASLDGPESRRTLAEAMRETQGF